MSYDVTEPSRASALRIGGHGGISIVVFRQPTGVKPAPMPSAIERAQTTLRRVATAMRRLGVSSALRYDLQRARRALGVAPAVVTLTARRSRHPLGARPYSTDFVVFGQTFVSEPYACLDDVADVDLIVDCGANVGFASAFLLSRFPNAMLYAVEPDPANFELLQRNLAPYGSRARADRAGVWSHNARLRIEERPYRGGGEWARQVRECRDGESSDIEAIDIPTILARSGRERISILKMDIEGAESVVLSAPNVSEWMGKVDCLAIELHDDTHFGDATGAFRHAIAGQAFDVTQSRELTVCRRRA
jgi:FkbM family methyltransferase